VIAYDLFISGITNRTAGAVIIIINSGLANWDIDSNTINEQYYNYPGLSIFSEPES